MVFDQPTRTLSQCEAFCDVNGRCSTQSLIHSIKAHRWWLTTSSWCIIHNKSNCRIPWLFVYNKAIQPSVLNDGLDTMECRGAIFSLSLCLFLALRRSHLKSWHTTTLWVDWSGRRAATSRRSNKTQKRRSPSRRKISCTCCAHLLEWATLCYCLLLLEIR